jgi:hypothetical protein
VVDKKADYLLALKGNQGSLREDVELFVAEQKAAGFRDTTISRDQTVQPVIVDALGRHAQKIVQRRAAYQSSAM